ncbi:MAG: hypothetical protein EBY18_15385 [Alphaproteobacteria bacterium]|nr:hypothetical protein [Alphaproteobacteria bacterium]
MTVPTAGTDAWATGTEPAGRAGGGGGGALPVGAAVAPWFDSPGATHFMGTDGMVGTCSDWGSWFAVGAG